MVIDEYPIEKDIPISPPGKYPFGAMSVGDSFALPADSALAVRCAANVYGKRRKCKFSTRRHGEGYRCWRIE